MDLFTRSQKGAHALKAIFYTLVGIFILIANFFLIPSSVALKRTLFPFVAVLAFIFFVLGAILIFLTLKLKIKGKLKVFLILAGVAAVAILPSAILHNLVYALFVYLFGEGFWKGIGLAGEPFFFIIAIIVCPILFLVGAIGSVVLFIKERKKKS